MHSAFFPLATLNGIRSGIPREQLQAGRLGDRRSPPEQPPGVGGYVPVGGGRKLGRFNFAHVPGVKF